MEGFQNEQAWMDAGAMRREQPPAGLFRPESLPQADGVPAARRFTVDWIDSHRKATEPADPTYPDGCAIDVALGAPQACRVELPYPAAHLGMWVVVCTKCGFAIALATAGRADDPRSVRVPCKTGR
jgi:hypothetical protein